MNSLKSWRSWPPGSVIVVGILLGTFVGILAGMFDVLDGNLAWFPAGGIFLGALGEAARLWAQDTRTDSGSEDQ